MKESIQIATSCAKVYEKELAGKYILFVYDIGEYVECYFPHSSYLHLTGLVYAGSASDFYRQCLAGRLSPDKLSFKKDGTTRMKLQILPQMVEIHRRARMIGSYNGIKPLLITDQLVGNPLGCMGFVSQNGILKPNTALKEDIRNLTKDTKRILTVFRKDCNADKYYEICYLAKGISIEAPELQIVKAEKCRFQET